jgi:hypothetical protein
MISAMSNVEPTMAASMGYGTTDTPYVSEPVVELS